VSPDQRLDNNSRIKPQQKTALGSPPTDVLSKLKMLEKDTKVEKKIIGALPNSVKPSIYS